MEAGVDSLIPSTKEVRGIYTNWTGYKLVYNMINSLAYKLFTHLYTTILKYTTENWKNRMQPKLDFGLSILTASC